MAETKVANILQILMGDMSESALARAVNLPKATINRVLSGVTPDPRAGTLLPIAQYFNISIEQLMGIVELPQESPLRTTETLESIQMPLIPFDKLSDWVNGSFKPDIFYDITSFSNKPMDKNCFITRLESDEMAPLFSNKTYLIIKMQKTALVDDIVLIYNENNHYFYIKKYIALKGEKYLFSINPAYDIISFDNKIKLIGIVLEGRIII